MLSRVLKNWVDKHQPPANGRARLLTMAVYVPRKKYNLSALIPRPQFNDYPIYTNNEWSQTLCAWFFEQSIHASVQARA